MPQNAALQFTLPEQSDWRDNMLIRPYDYVPVNVPQILFFDESTGHARKIWSGDETTW